jgi:hypothetical protein
LPGLNFASTWSNSKNRAKFFKKRFYDIISRSATYRCPKEGVTGVEPGK